jgi:hypothetical protein
MWCYKTTENNKGIFIKKYVQEFCVLIYLLVYLVLFQEFACLFQTAAKHLNVSVDSLCWEFAVLTVDENAIVELPQVSYVAITFCESI